MKLKITTRSNQITITLIDKRQIIDSLDLTDINNSSKILLKNIDFILKKNHLRKNQIKKFLIDSDLPDSYTSNRIVKSLEKTFNFALSSK